MNHCRPFQKRKQNKTKNEEGAVVKRVKSEPISDEEKQCGSSSDIEENKMVSTISNSIDTFPDIH